MYIPVSSTDFLFSWKLACTKSRNMGQTETPLHLVTLTFCVLTTFNYCLVSFLVNANPWIVTFHAKGILWSRAGAGGKETSSVYMRILASHLRFLTCALMIIWSMYRFWTKSTSDDLASRRALLMMWLRYFWFCLVELMKVMSASPLTLSWDQVHILII